MSSLNAIQSLLIKEFGLSEHQVEPATTLEELNIDSLATIEFMFLIEDTFKLKMPEEAVAIKTIGDIAREVDRLLDAQSQ